MSAPTKPFDTHSDLFKRCFEVALPYDAYVATGNDSQRDRWKTVADRLSLTEPQSAAVSGYVRTMNVLVLSGIWCGDCMRQGPMLHTISKASEKINLRFIDNQANAELRDLMRIQGGTRVPVAIFLSEDFFEVARFGDRTLSVYRRKAERELGPACDAGIVPPSESELAQELAEWGDLFERSQLILRLSGLLRERYGD